MEMRPFGRTGLRVSALGFGAAEIGFENTTDRTVDAILGAAADIGVNVIDTAAMYSDSEEKIGRVLRGRRNQYLFFTKCGRCPPPRPILQDFCSECVGRCNLLWVQRMKTTRFSGSRVP